MNKQFKIFYNQQRVNLKSDCTLFHFYSDLLPGFIPEMDKSIKEVSSILALSFLFNYYKKKQSFDFIEYEKINLPLWT